MINYPLRHTIRLRDYDYTQNGAYFITICTRHRESLFGQIVSDIVLLIPAGTIVQSCWADIKTHFPDIELSAYIVMPNHLHGIIFININNNVGTQHAVSAPVFESFGKPVAGSLPTIIRSFKSAASRTINTSVKGDNSSIWQRGYYEHVIRDEDELVQIGDYILGNPGKWQDDRDNPDSDKSIKPQSFEY